MQIMGRSVGVDDGVNRRAALALRRPATMTRTKIFRVLVALVARFHRRSAPERNHRELASLTASEVTTVRKLAMILRMADSLDRSHQQPIKEMRVFPRSRTVQCRLITRAPVDLELWDAQREAPLFRRILGKRIDLTTRKGVTR